MAVSILSQMAGFVVASTANKTVSSGLASGQSRTIMFELLSCVPPVATDSGLVRLLLVTCSARPVGPILLVLLCSLGSSQVESYCRSEETNLADLCQGDEDPTKPGDQRRKKARLNPMQIFTIVQRILSGQDPPSARVSKLMDRM